MRQLVALLLLSVLTFAAYSISASSFEPQYDEWGKISLRPQESALEAFTSRAEYLIRAQVFTEAFRDGLPADSAVIVADLNSPLTIGYSANKPLVSASLYKLFTAYYTYQDIDNGLIELSDELEESEETIEECLRIMIVASDNDCAIELSERIGWDVLDVRIAEDGFRNTTVNNYIPGTRIIEGDKFTTVAEIAQLLKRLYDGELLEPESTQRFLQLLSEQEVNDRQPEVLPDGVEIWHKTGNLFEAAHDAGFIIKGDQAYLYAIMTADWQENAFFSSQQFYIPFFEGLFDIFDLEDDIARN